MGEKGSTYFFIEKIFDTAFGGELLNRVDLQAICTSGEKLRFQLCKTL